MSVPRYPIILTQEERERLTRLIRTGKIQGTRAN